MNVFATELRADAAWGSNSVSDALAIKAADELEAKDALITELVGALDRQCDNVAFILNHVDLHAWHGKFDKEVEADRLTLSKAKLNTPNDTGV